MESKKLGEVAGIGPKLLASLNKNGKFIVADLTEDEIQNLPKEARLTIKYLSGRRFTSDEILKVILEMEKWLDEYSSMWIATGSYRRGKDPLKDIDIVAILKKVLLFPKDVIMIRAGNLKYKFFWKSKSIGEYVPVDILVTDDKHWASSILHFTGSKEFNIKSRIKAKEKGYTLNEYGLWKKNRNLNLDSEEKILTKLYGKYIKPEDRN